MIRTATTIGRATFALSLVLASIQPATAEVSRAEAERLLAVADGESASAAALQAQCQRLRRENAGDPRIDYLCGVAMLSERQYAKALPYFDRYLAAEPEDLPAARTRIWLRLQLRQFAPALDDCLQLIERAPRQPGDREWAETAQFAGTVFAYFEAARPEAGGDSQAKAARKQRVLMALEGSYLESFDAGRQLVIEQLANLGERDRQRQQQELQSQLQRKEELATNSAENRENINRTELQIQSDGESLREAQRKFGLAQHQAISLQVDRGRIAAQAVAVQARMLELQRSLRDNGRGGVIVSQVDVLMMDNLAITLAALNKQIFDIDRRLVALGQDAAQMVQQADQSSRSLASRQNAIERAEKRSVSLEKQTLRLEKEQPRSSGAIGAQQRSLARYFASPVESERARVLGWFD